LLDFLSKHHSEQSNVCDMKNEHLIYGDS